MRISASFLLFIPIATFVIESSPTLAVEKGQFFKKEGEWEYYSGEEPDLKYLYMKGVISEEE